MNLSTGQLVNWLTDQLLLPYLLPQHLPNFLQISNILKRILGNQEKRAGIEIEVEKIRAFYKIAEFLPFPAFEAIYSFQLAKQHHLLERIPGWSSCPEAGLLCNTVQFTCV